jgi:hypothetical protein
MDKERKKKEDEYFARIEFERRQKQITDNGKQLHKDEKQKLKDLHWMHCPKCGMKMIEIDFEGIKVDKCSSCLGVYFDDGELAQLSQKTEKGYLRRLYSIFED